MYTNLFSKKDSLRIVYLLLYVFSSLKFSQIISFTEVSISFGVSYLSLLVPDTYTPTRRV